MTSLLRLKLVVIALFFLSACFLLSDGRLIQTAEAFSSGPPPGYTRAPGEEATACAECHVPSGIGGGTGTFTIQAPLHYSPGQTYQITVVHNTSDATRKRWGFELTALGDDGNKAGNLQPRDTTTQLKTGGPGGARQYIEHTATGNFEGQLNGASWTFNWTAPAQDIGAVTFYAAGNQANADHNSSGDNIYTTFVGMTPAPAVVDIPPDRPTVLSTSADTRAIALEAVTLRSEPFPLTATVQFGSDTRERIVVFVMNTGLIQGESVSAISADVQDSANKSYQLTVENISNVPGFAGIQMLTLRLADNLGDVGDVLLRLNVHGVASNRVRIAIGHKGGGPADDAGSVPTPAPAVAPSATPTPTPNPYTNPSFATASDSVRFLEQSTFGPTPSLITHVRSVGYRAFLDEQFAAADSSYPALVLMNNDASQGCPSGSAATCNRDNYSMYPLQLRFYTNALYGPDQLRQRVAFALNEIMVVSNSEINQPSWMSPYLQVLDRNAFGNFRTLLGEMTLNPAMGRYLDMAGNSKSAPNENYAREVLQLFSVGLYKLNQDGTQQVDAQGNPIPTYDQNTITNFARVFTGWNIPAVAGQNGISDYINPMTLNANNHDTQSKTVLNGTVLAAGTSTQAYAIADLNAALDNIFNNPNVGPFIGRQLIQHLVTSNPSPAFVSRVAGAFNNNGQGVRGDMKAVITAILLDPEARGDAKTDPKYGHLREPALYITNLLRAFDAESANRTTASDGYLAPQSQSMDQDLFRSPTVFNFYSPDHEIPGTTLYGPEYEIFSTTTSLKRANFANTMIFSNIGVSTNSPNGTSIDLSGLQSLANNPADSTPLLDYLNNLMLHGSMSAAMRTSISTALAAIPGSDSASALLRARTALYLVATSSQYQIER